MRMGRGVRGRIVGMGMGMGGEEVGGERLLLERWIEGVENGKWRRRCMAEC